MKKLLHLIIPVFVLALAGGVFMWSKLTVKADPPETFNIGENGANDYWEDPETGGRLFVIDSYNYDLASNTYTIRDEDGNVIAQFILGTITIPANCTLAIDPGDNTWDFTQGVNITSITIQTGGRLAIFGETTISYSTIINPDNGACIEVDRGAGYFPAGVPGLYRWDGQTLIDQGDNAQEFFYDSTAAIWKCAVPSGKSQIIAECNNRIFAYSAPTDLGNLKTLLAQELFNKFLNGANFHGFRFYGSPNSISKIITIDTSNPSGTINVSEFDHNNIQNNLPDTRPYYNATVNWGIDEVTGNPVTSTIPVVVLSSESVQHEFLVCIDYDPSDFTGSPYYVRTVHTDKRDFAAGTDTFTFGDGAVEQYIIMTDSIGNVVIAGDGMSFDEYNTDGMFSAQITKYPDEECGIPGESYNGVVRILNPSDTYIAVTGEGEPNKVDGMGLNGYPTDNVWETGDNASARVFIGYTTLFIKPLNLLTGYGFGAITDVELINESQRDGVEIDKSDLNSVKLTFKSNFYDSVPIRITYAGGVVKTLTIDRIGLVMRYLYLYGEQSEGTIYCDCNPAATHTFNYNYEAGEQILVYATYYHPTNYDTKSGSDDLYLNLLYENGTQRIIGHNDAARNFNGYSAPGSGAVATTTFIIDIISGGDQTHVVYPAFYATVLNAGFNDDTTYGGTQAGSGKGVYWDGNIYWERKGL